MNDAALGFKLREVILSSLELMLQFEKELLDAPGQGYKYLVLSNVTKLVFSSHLKVQGHYYLTSITLCIHYEEPYSTWPNKMVVSDY